MIEVLVETPPGYSAERDYALSVVLGQHLGLVWNRRATDRNDVRVSVSGSNAEIVMPDLLFGTSCKEWLTSQSMPKLPLAGWEASRQCATILRPRLPVIYGDPEPVVRSRPNSIRLPVDIFGSAFFMLSRYEEVALGTRDEHKRFPARSSLAYQAGFLNRPIIDEYTELLWAAMTDVWPGLARKEYPFTIKLSHDVDRPSRYAFGPVRTCVRAVGGDLLLRRDFNSVVNALKVRWGSREELSASDPYNTFNWIMDLSERYGLRSAFYFICGRTDRKRDALYDLEFPSIRALLRRIHARGHEIGLHPSYGTYLRPDRLASEAECLRRICHEEGIKQEVWGGRMHYLRWNTPITLHGWERAGMDYDCSLGYAECPGFRCGTAREYFAFDPVERINVSLCLRPLVAMDISVLSPKYRNHNEKGDAVGTLLELKNACRKLGGAFTLLWHNSELRESEDRVMFEAVVDG